MGKMGGKMGFFKFTRKFSDFFRIWSIMKVYTVCCILGQSGYRIFKSTISLEQSDEKV